MMQWQTPYTLVLFFASGITLALAIYSWRQGESIGAKIFSVLLLLITVWSGGYGLEIASSTLSTKIFWGKFQYIGIAFTPVVWFYFSLQYTDRERWFNNRFKIFLLFVEPVITVIIAWTNDFHHLIWTSIQLSSVSFDSALVLTYGIWFWVHVVYSYFFLFLGTITLLTSFFRRHALYREQVKYLLIGALIPWIGNLLYITDLNPLPNFDLTPFAFSLTGLITAVGLFRHQLLNIIPIARKTIIESMHDGIFVLDSQNRVIDLNPAASKVISKQDDYDVIGRSFTDILPECAHLIATPNKLAGSRTDIQLFMGTETRFFEVRSVPLTEQQQRHPGWLIVVHDTTTHKQIEEELQKAKKEAETAVQTKSAFLANMSHEIRTPLNAVIGMAELLRNTPLTAEQQELIETIYTSSDTLLNLINNILDFSKIETGKINLENKPFDLQDCLEISINIISPLVNHNSVNLAYYIDEQTPPTFDGDVVRLRQILVNLLGNAAKFTDEGEISVHVTSEQLEEEMYRLHFVVKDSGIGISDDRLSNLFKSFTQADPSTTRKYGGTGLGLAISRKLCQLMGGDISVNSKVGVGSAFRFTVVVSKATGFPTHLLNPDLPHLRGKRILIITENADIRRLIGRETRSWGMRPYIAGSSREALYWLRTSDPFDVGLVDQAILIGGRASVIQKLENAHSAPLSLVLLRTDVRYPSGLDDVPWVASLRTPFTPAQLNNVLARVFSTAQGTITQPLPTLAGADMARHHPLRILLAEDNKINQIVAIRILANLGYHPDIVGNGLQVLEAVDQKTYDVIIMDIQMPEMDGLEATKQIHERWPSGKRPIIIALTAHAMEGDREHYLANGMDDYLSKPIQIKNLVEALYKCAPATITPVGSEDDIIEPDHDSPIDAAILEELLGSKATSILQDLLPIFIEDAEKAVTNINQAFEEGNKVQLKSAAHSLKGTSANLGMQKLSKLCKKLEAITQSSSLDMAEQVIRDISLEVERVKTLIAVNVEE